MIDKPKPSKALADQTLNDWPQRTAVHLDLPEDLSFDKWKEVGQNLSAASSSLRWYVGDWLIHGDRRWGQVYSEAMQLTPLSYDTLAHCRSVAVAFEFWRRRQKLSWSEHREVAPLSIENQDRILDELEASPVRVPRNQLRHMVAAAHRQEEEARKALLTDEERAERSAALDAKLRTVTATIIGHVVGLQPIVRLVPQPTIRLDNSGAGDPVPETLRSLKIEPPPEPPPEPPQLDRTQIAMSAISTLEFDQALSVVHWWFGTLNGKQQNAVYEKITPRHGFKADERRIVTDVEPDNV